MQFTPSFPQTVDARCFVDLAHAVSRATRSCGLDPPGFQTLPRRGQHGRVVRRTSGGAVVAIRTTGKSPEEVRNDMIDGVVRLQGQLSEPDEQTLRKRIESGLPPLIGLLQPGGQHHGQAA